MIYHFQNPNSGYPMYLTDRRGMRVECAIDDDIGLPTDQDLSDASRYSRAVAYVGTIHAAALVLKSMGCEDIFD
jgi:hypothetical protein